MARKSRYMEYAKYVSKEQAKEPAPSVKPAKSVLGRLTQMKAKVKETNCKAVITA